MRAPLLVLTVVTAVLSMAPVAAPALAQGEGYRVVRTPHGFAGLEERVAAAVGRAGLIVVTRASASDGARGRGLTIRGDAVYGIFRNDFALRMLADDVRAGIEAPIRLHLTEEADGTTAIRYHTPSAVFAPYGGPALATLARELDGIFAAIVADAAAP